MAIVRWDPVREVNTIQSEMNRLFNTFFDAPSHQGSGNGAGRRWLPAMDLVESGDAYVLRADLPGVAEEDVHLELEDGVLTLSGERHAEHREQDGGAVRLERSFGSFRRQLTLPEGVDPETIAASFEQGVLEVRIPKPEERKPQKVSIRVGSAPETLEAPSAPDAEGPPSAAA